MKLGLNYVYIRFDKTADADEDEEEEHEWFHVRKHLYGANKTKAGGWRLATSMSTPLAADDLDELSDIDSESGSETRGEPMVASDLDDSDEEEDC